MDLRIEYAQVYYKYDQRIVLAFLNYKGKAKKQTQPLNIELILT